MSKEKSSEYAKQLGRLIKVETISKVGQTDLSKFHHFHDLLKKEFPALFKICEIKEFDGSLLLKWKGKSSNHPAMFMNHHDVVEATGTWEHDPFCGEVFDDKVWGRGAIDTKGGLWAMLRAAEELISDGFVPENDIYFESGCNEEIDGEGSDAISKYLLKEKVKLDMCFDEGGFILNEPIPGAAGTFAVVGVSEKGCIDLKFIARSNGGHASMPGKDTPLVRLGKFMVDIEKHCPFKVKLGDVTMELFRRLSPTFNGPLKIVLGHPKLFKGLLEKVMPSVSASAAAMLRTTLAFTMAKGADGLNVLPQEAYVTGNMRFSHHEGLEHSLQVVREIANKYDIEMETLTDGLTSPITDFNSRAFKLVEEGVSKVFPGIISAPYIMTGASDSRYMARVCDNCIRFLPFHIDDSQLGGMHGLNENINVSSLVPAVEFYKYLITEV